MADRNDRSPGNAAGTYYVDSTCIDCDLCRETAPATFSRNDEIGQTIAIRQPVGADEIALAEQAREACPTESIGNDG